MTGTGAWFGNSSSMRVFGVVVTSSVAIAGVLLVFSFLIVPAAIGVMFASSLARQEIAIGWIVGTLTSAAGLAASFAFDLPTGAAMVCAFGGALAVAGLLYPFLRGNRQTCIARCDCDRPLGAPRAFAGSAIQLAAAPRADQPLLHARIRSSFAATALYFTRAEKATFVDRPANTRSATVWRQSG